MILPLLISWVRAKDYLNLKRLALYLLGLGAAFLVLFLWSPYPYVKLLGFSDAAIKMTLLPSLSYYTKIIIFDQPFLSLAVLLCLVGAIALRQNFLKSTKFWILFLPLFIHFVFFSSIVHSEPRYMMPFVLLLYICAFSFLLSAWKSKITYAIFVLLILETAYQGATVIRWSQLAWNGPKEFQAINQIKALPSTSTAIYVEGEILGAVHDKVSLDGYVAKCTDGSFDMFKFMQGLDVQTPGLHVDYFCNKKTSSGKPLENYDYIITPMGEELTTNYFEENLLRLWSAANLRSYYFQAKSTP